MNDNDESIIEDTVDDDLQQRNKKEESKLKSQIKKEGKKHAKNATKKLKPKMKATLFRVPVGATIFSSVATFFIIIVMIIGTVSFIVSMPGLVKEKMYALVGQFASSAENWLFGDNRVLNNPNSDEMKKAKLDLLKYLDEMGLDPIGLGFASTVFRNDEGEIFEYLEGSYSASYIKQLTGESYVDDLLYKYIISSERTYLLDDSGFLGMQGIIPKYTGMIHMNIGIDDITSNISVDRITRTMTIKIPNFVDGTLLKQSFSYNLDNWIGVYGKPVEFLLAIHIATMSPDLTEELITNEYLQTKVYVDVTHDEYDVDYKVKVKDENGNFVELPILFGDKTNSGLYQKIKSNIKYSTDESGNIKCEYVESEDKNAVTKKDITISSLKYLIDEMMLEVAYSAGGELSTEYENSYMQEAISAFLGTDKYCVKFDIADMETLRGYNNIGPFICKVDSTSNEPIADTGILKNSDLEQENGVWYYLDGNGIYGFVVNGENPNADKSTYKIYGLQYYLNNIDSIKDENVKNAITVMLAQIDMYLYKNNEMLGSMEFVDDESIKDIVGVQIRKDPNSNPSVIHSYYTKRWKEEILNNMDSMSNEEIKNALQQIINDLQLKLNVVVNKDIVIEQLIDSLMNAEVGENTGDLIDISVVKDVYDGLKGNENTAKMSTPRIKYVVNHWYRDLDFTGKYKETSETKEIPAETNNENVQITAVLTKGDYEVQSGQPYVIKGKLVTLDGEDVSDEYHSLGDTGISKYEQAEFRKNLGKGYEVSKKLFTQGNYYRYDGTEETSRGVYLCKVLEKVKVGNTVKVQVIDGRIVVIDLIDGNSWQTEGEEILTNVGSYCTIRRIADNKNTKGQDVHNYYVYINKSIKYKSVADYTYEESKESVDIINEILETMDIITLRQPVSFDNVAVITQNENGDKEKTIISNDITALTAFSILEGMHTESAEMIYRDLKEFLIELGYYTKAEFDYISSNVLDWFIPEYVPKDSVHWQENREEDIYEYGAIIYPNEVDESTDEVKHEGFAPDLEVVAPGNCKIIEYTENSITIRFDGASQPEIGMLHGYSMLINGIKVNSEIKEAESENVISIDDANANGTIIKAKSVIGLTGTEKIQVILKNQNGAYISNVEEYMAIKDNSKFIVGEGSCLEQVIALMNTFTSFSNVGSRASSTEGVYNNHWDRIVKYSSKYGVDPYLVLAKITQECPGDGSLEDVLSHNGAGGGYGVGQFQWDENLHSGSSTYVVTFGDGTSETFELISKDSFLNDLDLQVHLAVAMLKAKLDCYGGNVVAALQAYNLGDGGLQIVVESYLGREMSLNEFREYMANQDDLGWLNKRWQYCDTDGDGISNRGDPNYVENVLKFYILEQ